jgi:hypothetical protein
MENAECRMQNAECRMPGSVTQMFMRGRAHGGMNIRVVQHTDEPRPSGLCWSTPSSARTFASLRLCARPCPDFTNRVREETDTMPKRDVAYLPIFKETSKLKHTGITTSLPLCASAPLR